MKKSIDALTKRYLDTLTSIPKEIRETVNKRGGLSESKLLELILNPQDQGIDRPSAPLDSQIRIECDIDVCVNTGNEELLGGKVAYCIVTNNVELGSGEPTALMRIPDLGISLLTIKLFQAIGTGPIWILVSPSTKHKIVSHVNSQIGIDHSRIRYIEQFESYRLYPNNDVIISEGKPDLYSCGTGDLFPALVHSGVMQEFIDKGGKYISVVNVDNILASLDPMLIGWHALSLSNVTCEVVKREINDAGGFVCVDRGQLQVTESYRMYNVDTSSFKWLNTNSLIFNANLNIEPLGDSWNRVQKSINGNLVIQYERLLEEITEAYNTMFVAVDRNKRFFLIKKQSDLILASKKLNIDEML